MGRATPTLRVACRGRGRGGFAGRGLGVRMPDGPIGHLCKSCRGGPSLGGGGGGLWQWTPDVPASALYATLACPQDTRASGSRGHECVWIEEGLRGGGGA